MKILHPWVQKFYPVLGLGSGGRLLGAFPDSNSVLDKLQSATKVPEVEGKLSEFGSSSLLVAPCG